jgi:hypothetical protein
MLKSGSVLLVGVLAGCQVFVRPPDEALEGLLKPVTTSPESVMLEIFHARIPLDKDSRADAIWDHVDEMRFSKELREALYANGLRAGVVGAPLPAQLSELLALESEMPTASTTRVIDGHSAVPRVTKRVLQLNRRDEKQIQVSEVRDEAAVVLSDGASVGGGNYRQAQGVYVLRAETAPGQRGKVRMTPELHHGELKMRYAGRDDGILVQTPSRDREVFDRLALETELSPGELLVLGCLPEAKASLGGLFHTASVAGKHERKLIVLRLLQVPPSEILAAK